MNGELVGLLAGTAMVLAILYICRDNILAIILFFATGALLSVCMGAGAEEA